MASSRTYTAAPREPAGPLVRAYLAALTPATRARVRALRAAIRSAAPDARDAFSYGMPGFVFAGRPLVSYAGWKHHASLYPLSSGMRAAGGTELDGYDKAKGTLRFPLSEAIPVALVRRLVKARVTELRSRGAGAARAARRASRGAPSRPR